MFAKEGDHVKSDRTELDVLYEILLKFGLELTVPILENTIHEQKVYNIGYGSLYICLSERIGVDVAKGIGEWHKEFADEEPTVIFRDSGFPDDAAKTNAVQMLKQYGIEKVNSI